MILDISSLRTSFVWNRGTAHEVDLHAVFYALEDLIRSMMSQGIIANRASFGFAMADPRVNYREVWNDPAALTGFIAYWGPEGQRYAANAVRKMRPGAREDKDTQKMRLDHPELFRDPVESAEADGTFNWGDFPYDGAVHLHTLGYHLLGAVSALPKEEDPIPAQLILGLIGLEMHRSDLALQAA